jgi:hypothetical protein
MLSFVGESYDQPNHGKGFEYVQLSSLGLYMYKFDIGETKRGGEGEEDVKSTNPYRVMNVIVLSLVSAKNFYNQIGYRGSVKVTVDLDTLLGKAKLEERNYVTEYTDIPADTFKWERELSIIDIEQDLLNIGIDLCHEILWSLGVKKFTKDRIKEYLNTAIMPSNANEQEK